jgi:Protein of unknown function (DUF2934)
LEQLQACAIIGTGQLSWPGAVSLGQSSERIAVLKVTVMAYPTDEQIREYAYRLWLEAGKPEDREREFWHQAERQLQALADPQTPDPTG